MDWYISQSTKRSTDFSNITQLLVFIRYEQKEGNYWGIYILYRWNPSHARKNNSPNGRNTKSCACWCTSSSFLASKKMPDRLTSVLKDIIAFIKLIKARVFFNRLFVGSKMFIFWELHPACTILKLGEKRVMGVT